MRRSAGRASRSVLCCAVLCCAVLLSLGLIGFNMRHYHARRSHSDQTSSAAQVHEDFFSKPGPMQLYKNSVQKIIGRVNTINGRMYRDDPTIMSWCAAKMRMIFLLPCSISPTAGG